ncbi:MAG: histidinol-phosphatase [Muribaculum sp.]|nr:histidinol-phosphatase [Muribaculum sp.]
MLHSHTQFCDGHAPMEDMVRAAYEAGLQSYGFSPHSPIPIPSPCNMRSEDVPSFIDEARRLARAYQGRMRILTGMEVDFLSKDWGPHSSYFHEIDLDYRIGSVHFVPNRQGVYIDCDGSAERFLRNLHEAFGGDLRYVADKYFSQVREMIALGGFEILGHLDKIAANADAARNGIEEESWWADHVQSVIREAASAGLTIEINTKAYLDKGRFFPALRWWPLLKSEGATVVFHSDAHWPQKVTSGLAEAQAAFSHIADPVL